MVDRVLTRSAEAGATSSDQAQRAGERWTPWLLLAPVMLIMTAVGIYPLLHSFYTSLTGYRPADPDRFQGFVGMANYASALGDDLFWNSLLLTLVFTTASVTISLVLSVLLAVLFNQPRAGFVLMRTILLVPMLITPIAVGITWRIMMMPDLGVLNYLFRLVGLPPLTWVSSKATAMASIVLVDVWQWTPFMFIIIFAGLRALPKSPFEAAAIDGAGPFTTFFGVTLPMLKPVIVIAVLLRIIDAMRTYDTVYILTRGGPDFATDLVSIYLQRVNFRFFDLGYGAAMSWLVLLVILAIVIIFAQLSGFIKLLEAKEAR
jgi:multiple sugar transport system permease protein